MDPFAVLGVPRDAPIEDIRLAYRKLAMEHHPDRNGGSKEAEAKFKEINAAFEILKDPAKRAEAQRGPGPSSAAHNNFGFGFGGGSGAPHFDFSFDDIFSAMHAKAQRRNPDINGSIRITLLEAFYGVERDFSLQTRHGERKVRVSIPAGVDEGMRLKVAAHGEQFFYDMPPGDLLLQIRVVPDGRFTRVAQNLVSSVTIDAFDALLGTEIEIETLDMKRIVVQVPAGVQNDQRLRVTGHGMPVVNSTERGDLIVSLKVVTPAGLHEAERSGLCAVRDLYRARVKDHSWKNPST